jgi:hypothetical protein
LYVLKSYFSGWKKYKTSQKKKHWFLPSKLCSGYTINLHKALQGFFCLHFEAPPCNQDLFVSWKTLPQVTCRPSDIWVQRFLMLYAGEGLLSGTSLQFQAQVTTLKLEEACENGPSLTYTIVLGLVWQSIIECLINFFKLSLSLFKILF